MLPDNKPASIQFHHRRHFNRSQQSMRSSETRKNKSVSSETIQNFSKQIEKLQSEDQEMPAASPSIIRRKSLADDMKSSLYQVKDINFSQIKNKKQKSEFGRFRMLIQKSKIPSKQEKEILGSIKKRNNNFFQSEDYKTIHTQFLNTLREQKQQTEKDEDPQIKTAKLPSKDPEYFKGRLSSLKNSSFFSTQFSIQLNNSSYLFPSEGLRENKNQFEDTFEEIGRKIWYQEHQNPGTIIYNHFNDKHRDYYTIKSKELNQNSKKYKNLHKEQSAILSDLKKKGLSQESRFQVLSHFYDTYLKISGHKQKNEKTLLKQRINNFHQRKNQ